MSLPNTILIGAQKAGTTSLYYHLSLHPDIYAPTGMKDFPFFLKEEYYRLGLEWFSKNYGNTNSKIKLHGCVNYIYNYRISAERIHGTNKDTKIVAVLRNPSERAYSAYWQARKVGMEPCKTFEEALALENDRLNGNFVERNGMTYLQQGFYYNQLKYYLKKFGNSLIKIILFDELKNDQFNTYVELLDFLEVDNTFKPVFTHVNESGLPRSISFQKIINSTKIMPAIKNLIPIKYRISIRNALNDLNTVKFGYPPINPETKRKLNLAYRDEIGRIEGLICRDLSHWEQS